ncbi:precorrin-6Y C5,15-methyltransferase (decarboxylating) [Tamaricihabitans halophyticus]|uniref:Precorrin-6Y C5,15-methyltransferase (Decarboxylating) n=1 Tax=Tamaricihabitans halophyticus TaxID=1262583 RepID=A0A4R2QMJ9_9PSEU|nr:precorrin-6y C5,15-methyltransferase (decarboxylating) subunit CbiE [Tamaricihabitans halophyticus]TCP50793.1 precorrin-6Y C5,15-methyltransferase (decarboxylating) [Tamaricihabitans halophyticus]
MTTTVIGVDGAELAPGAAELLGQASLIVGARRYLDQYAPAGVTTVELGPLEPALHELSAAAGASVVLASGDPGFFGIVRALRDYGLRPAVIPAVSAVQRLVARCGRSWDDVAVVSAHGRDLGPALNVCRARRNTVVLTAPGAGPAELAAGLTGWRRTLTVAEQLGADTETVSTVDLAEACARVWAEPNIVLCQADPEAVPGTGWHAGGEPTPPAGGWALTEDAFIHRDGMITKAEVRAMALAKLGPRPGSMVWDVGAGCGSVAVESARLGAATIAIEHDPVQCVRVVANASAFGVDVRVVEADVLDVADELPAPDAVFVGGGGSTVIATCARLGAERVVVALASLDRIAPARETLRANGYAVSGAQLSTARMVDLPNGGSRLAATNPITLIWGSST